MKKISILLFSLVLIPTFSFGNDIILRCQDKDGGVLYINSKNIEKDKTLKCNQTNLAQIDILPEDTRQRNAANQNSLMSSRNNTNTNTNTNTTPLASRPVSIDLAEVERERRRIELLQNEIRQEKKALDSVQNMLNNLRGANDKEQISKLRLMKAEHERNITNLEKEISTKDNLSGILEINLNSVRNVSGPPAPHSLPINLPN